ncbi:MAG: protein kinase [Gemmatimonadaceae bacterium]|nr:protein kinase [Gemmatimonadaceae bacterium]
MGETSTVFMARRHGSVRPLALKACNAQAAPAISEFDREVQHLAAMSHPRIHTLLDAGVAGGVSYYTMPLLGSRTLSDVLISARLTTEEKLVLLRDVCAALAHVHAVGLMHNDVHPANIVVVEGRAILGDFGDARMIRTDDRLEPPAAPGAMSAPYQSPERVSAGAVSDPRSDIFAVGRIAQEMFAGALPGTSGGGAARQIDGALTRSGTGSRQFRRHLTSLIQSLVAHDPAKRPPSVVAVSDALDSLNALSLGESESRVSSRRGPAKVLGAIAIAAILVSSAWKLIPHDQSAGPAATPKIVVLPFEDLTRGSHYGWLATGLTHELIDALTLAPGLRVSSFEIGKSASDARVPLSTFQDRLGIQLVATGALEQLGAKLRLTVRVNDVSDPAAGGERFEVSADSGDLDHLRGAVNGEIATRLRRALGTRVKPGVSPRSTVPAEAWADFRMAEALQRDAELRLAAGHVRLADPELSNADSLYRSALVRDPRWNAPRVAIGWLYEARARVVADSTLNQCRQVCLRWRSQALALADSALAIEPRSIDALELRGTVRFELSFAPSRRIDSQALYDSSSVDLTNVVRQDEQRARAWITISAMRSRRGDAAAATTAIENAERADPWLTLGPEVQERAISSYLMMEAFDQADRRCRGGREAYPERASFQQCTLSIMGSVARGKSAIDSAWVEMRTTTMQAGDSTTDVTWWFRRAMVAAVIARSGLRDSAYRVLRASRAIRSTDDPNLFYQEAFVYGVAGDTARVVSSLSNYLTARPSGWALVQGDRWFSRYRSTEQFRRLRDSISKR